MHASSAPPTPPTPGREELADGRMPFLEHLRELRDRVRNSVIYLIIGFGICYAFSQQIYAFLARPLVLVWLDLAENNPAVGVPSFQFKSLIEPFWTYFSVALWAGFFVASPFIFFELWRFIAPGLYKKERRYGVAFAICSALLFACGAAFCYAIIQPIVFDFLLSYSSESISDMSTPLGTYSLDVDVALKPQLFMKEFLDISRKLLLAFGLVFELPLAIFFLSVIGVVNHRSLIKFSRWMIVVSVVISAVLTPPDVFSQVLLAGPILVMYFLSIGISFLITRAREARERAAEKGTEKIS
ncbi:MAG: twin-arginine translocase subunit TatC [Deltaproteobacteria bacterium]|nr:twin-arginine translocase subunit TatC [Deltaproteobacteria bacterium]